MQTKSRVHADPSLHQNHFDQIPDSLILLIFNKLADVRSLGRCLAVSKRFNSLVPLVHDLFVKIDQLVPVDGDYDAASLSLPKPRNIFAHLLKLILLAILRPFHHLLSTNGGNTPLFPQVSHHSPSQVLKKFKQVHNLKIELPTGDVGTEDGVFLKWRAEFGSTLQNCLVLGGTRIEHGSSSVNLLQESVEDDGRLPESFYTDGGLKLRVIWTISSLLAASTRHHLFHQIVKEHTALRSLVLTDADGQGTLTMGVEQLKEFREKLLAPSPSASSNRTEVPASKMKLRYAPYLELPERVGVQGATLVVVKPDGDGEGSSCGYCGKREMEALSCGAFDGPLFEAAVKALGKKRTYLLEMNGF